MNAHSNQSQAQNYRTMRKSKSARLPGRPLAYVQDTIDPSLIRLMNGQMLRQPIPEVPLCINKRGWVYSLTHAGLRRRRTNFWKKNHYGKRTRSGNSQGQVYPYVTFRNVTYRIHELMAQAWLHAKAYGEAIDHINGDIDNCELINLRVISKRENDRCGGILKRMRNAARRLKEPRLDPLNISRRSCWRYSMQWLFRSRRRKSTMSC